MNKENLTEILNRIWNNCEEIDNHNPIEDKTNYKMIEDIALLRMGILDLQKENTNLKQALNDIREYVKSTGLYETNINPDKPNIYNLELVKINDKILQIIDKVLGDEK